jgi:SAM-dependent methyltransferase
LNARQALLEFATSEGQGGVPAYVVADALRKKLRPPDRIFDQFLPPELRAVSSQFWTTIDVAVRAAEWIGECGASSVADVGSGVGKFCVVAALASGAHFVGIEQRSRLVEVGRGLAELFEVADRVTFVHGAASVDLMPKADLYYLYNPFGENLFPREQHLDEDVELSVARFRRDTAAFCEILECAPIGTHVLTYNGLGVRMPKGYRTVRVDRELPNVLRLWAKSEGGARRTRSEPAQFGEFPVAS